MSLIGTISLWFALMNSAHHTQLSCFFASAIADGFPSPAMPHARAFAG